MRVDPVSSRYDSISKMVGMDDQIKQLKSRVLGGWNMLSIISIVGMAGIGKTTLAQEIYYDPIVSLHFELRLLLTVGPQYQLTQLLLLALDQLGFQMDDLMDTKLLGDHLHSRLFGKRYLILLDDTWNTQIWHDDLRMFFPDNKNKSRIIMTTRQADISTDNVLRMRFLDDDESWKLLRKMVFTSEDQSCHPPQLEKIGRKIANNCEGLPLAIIEVGKLLCRTERKIETWNEIAENEDPLTIGLDDDTHVSKALSLSYMVLPQHLKPCFLYMGVFPKKYEISPSKLINLWVCEGFLEPRMDKTLEEVAKACLDELVYTSLVLVSKESSSGRIQTCRIHFVYRNLCIREAHKEKFFHIVKKYADIFPEGTNSQRGLCFHNNIVLGFKQVHSLMESVSGAISLLCFGPPHRYPIHVYLRFRLLRLVDALTIRFYEFPHQVLELVELRYLAITYDGEIPPSISGLVNLEVLIVHRHHRILKSSKAPMYLPIEIWKLHKLRHLQCMGYDMPDPCKENGFVDGSVTLESLLTLSGVSAHSCTRGVLERMPNLMKLGIRMIESSPYYSNEAYYVYNASSYLDRLESFKCIAIVNPDPDSDSNPDPDHDLDYSQLAYHPIPYPAFPDNIRKITLSGFGYPWYYMIIMRRLPNLEVLKLQCNAFRGPEWVTLGTFRSLKFLLLEDLDIEKWIAHRDLFPHLKCLIIRHCYKLREIPFSTGDIFTLEIIEVDDCSQSVATWIQKLHEELQDSRYESLQLRINSSWDDKKLKS